MRFAETDAAGKYVIGGLDWGTYKVFAMKEDVDYPDVSWSFYADNHSPSAHITPTSPVAEVQIRLGPKAGVLTGSVNNAINGAPLNAGFKLTRAEDPEKWISTSVAPRFRVLAPTSTDILLEVSAPGFKTWMPRHALRLKPGAEVYLDISLEPSHDPSLHASRFLVPENYVGWILLEYNAKNSPAITTENGIEVFRFPQDGKLNTSSPGPERGAEDEYLFYSRDGSTRPVPMDYRHGRGMVWGQYEGSKGGVPCLFGFFVGSEEEYKKQLLNKHR